MPLLAAVSSLGRLAPAARAGVYRHAFVLGVITGVVFFAGTLYWLVEVMTTFGGLSWPVAAVVAGLLVAFLALFPAALAVGLAFLQGGLGPRALLLTPALWVALELVRTYLGGGFPWVLLGYSQVGVLPVAQLASLFGVYGVSALVALVNAATAYALVSRARTRFLPAAAALACVAVTALWGSWRLAASPLTQAGSAVRVGLVQGNIAQDDKWNPERREWILARYVALSTQAVAQGADVVIWPESSTPFFYEEDRAGGRAIRELVRESGVHFLIGSDQVELPAGPTAPGRAAPRYYNAAFLIGPDGRTEAVYRKIHLVPFGEYVPLKRLLFFVSPLVETVADFSPGDRPVLLPVGARRTSTAICYEVIYPALMRRFVQEGSELLTTITNDAWYGHSSAPHQHFEQAAMRAIEQGRYLARAANTGISGFVDPYGRVTARSAIFETDVLVGDVRYLQDRTLYSRMGDVLAYLCAALAGGGLLAAFAARRPARGPARPAAGAASVRRS